MLCTNGLLVPYFRGTGLGLGPARVHGNKPKIEIEIGTRILYNMPEVTLPNT